MEELFAIKELATSPSEPTPEAPKNSSTQLMEIQCKEDLGPVQVARDHKTDLDELFAIEELAASPSAQPTQDAKQARQQPEYTQLMEIQSKEDPVLVRDARVLSNLITRQNGIHPNDYFNTVQTEVRPHMRKIVSDWMLEVTEEQQCQPEVFHLAINYLDRYLSQMNIEKTQFQLIACVCMFLASKFKETCPLAAEHLIIYTDYSVTIKDIMQWEMIVLDALQWDLSAVTPYSIMDHILRSVPLGPTFDREHVRQHAETFVALAANEHTFSLKSPVVVAVACFGAALRGLNPQGLAATMSYVAMSCGVQMDEVRECMNQIEVSINLSMSGMSFQANINNNASSSTVPKIIKQQQQQKQDCYPPASTTPTDVMDVSKHL